jgi:hypothetical protein
MQSNIDPTVLDEIGFSSQSNLMKHYNNRFLDTVL